MRTRRNARPSRPPRARPGRPREPPGRSPRRAAISAVAPYVFIAPFFIVFLAFGGYPLLYALRLSFTMARGRHPAMGRPRYYTYLLATPILGNR